MIRLYIQDRSGVAVNDPDRSMEYATGLTYSSQCPKGYGVASFSIKRDIVKVWLVKAAYKVIIRDGNRIVWQGFIESIHGLVNNSGDMVRIECGGPISILARRVIRKRWADNDPFSRFYWPTASINDGTQQRLKSTIHGNLCSMNFPGEAVTSSPGDDFWWQYDGVVGDTIVKVSYSYFVEAGIDDTGQIILYNVDQAGNEDTRSVSNGTDSGTVNKTLTLGATDSIMIGFVISATDGDADGMTEINSMIVYCKLDYTAGVPNYYADEIIKDVLYRVGESEFSTDYDQVASPGLALIPFTTNNDAFESADAVIQRAVAYGDGSANTWEFNVWDSEYKGTASDGKPKVELRQRLALTDWEYEMSIADLSRCEYEESPDELFNWITVEYQDADGNSSFVWPTTQATLKDQTSIDDWGRRDKPLNAGKSASAKAIEAGERFLAFHKDPLIKGQFACIGKIRTKQGLWLPASWVRAGERLRVTELDRVFYFSEVDYNVETMELTMTPDLPPDNLAVMQQQQMLQIKNPVM